MGGGKAPRDLHYLEAFSLEALFDIFGESISQGFERVNADGAVVGGNVLIRFLTRAREGGEENQIPGGNGERRRQINPGHRNRRSLRANGGEGSDERDEFRDGEAVRGRELKRGIDYVTGELVSEIAGGS